MTTTPDRRLIPLYDWMAAELLVIADEAAADIGDAAHRRLTRNILLGVANYVSHTRGTGQVDQLAEMAFPDLIVDPADWPLLDAIARQTTD